MKTQQQKFDEEYALLSLCWDRYDRASKKLCEMRLELSNDFSLYNNAEWLEEYNTTKEENRKASKLYFLQSKHVRNLPFYSSHSTNASTISNTNSEQVSSDFEHAYVDAYRGYALGI